MFRILLVDDERGIAEGLQFILEAAGRDWEVTGIAEDGQEGLELIDKYQPDIVITDVCMPVMDGLEMIRRLNDTRRDAGIRFIMLSGYSEFEYARQAVNLGVNYYITKPVEEEELYSVLDGVCAEIGEERNRAEKLASLEHTVESFREDRRERRLERILEGREDTTIAGDVLEELGFPSDGCFYLCMLWEMNGKADAEAARGLKERLKDALDEYMQTEAVQCSSGVRAAVVIADYEKPDRELLVQRIMEIKTAEEQRLDMPLSVGIGRPYEGTGGLAASFREAELALNDKVIRGIGSIIPYWETERNGSGASLREEDIQKLEGYLNGGDLEGCRILVHRLFREFAGQPDMTLQNLQAQSLNIILAALRTMPAMQFRLNEFLGKNILALENLAKFETMEQIENWIVNILTGVIELRQDMLSEKKQDLMTQIREYIRENYTKDISLNEIAKNFYISPYYLSQLFKKKMGETYQNYITSLRIEKAKQLLWEGEYKVYEIGEMVGYRDTAYFSRVFRKTAGCWPSEYRVRRMPEVNAPDSGGHREADARMAGAQKER